MKRHWLRSLTISGAAIGFCIGVPLQATTYSKTGRLANLYLSSGSNGAFRIEMDSVFAECISYNFAYINTSFDNYQAYVANLMAAYYAGRTVTVHYTVNPSGVCELLEFSVV